MRSSRHVDGHEPCPLVRIKNKRGVRFRDLEHVSHQMVLNSITASINLVAFRLKRCSFFLTFNTLYPKLFDLFGGNTIVRTYRNNFLQITACEENLLAKTK